jgi:hypothetical protein
MPRIAWQDDQATSPRGGSGAVLLLHDADAAIAAGGDGHADLGVTIERTASGWHTSRAFPLGHDVARQRFEAVRVSDFLRSSTLRLSTLIRRSRRTTN